MIRCRPIGPRRGFTLVEILVAAALTVLTMAILATAFQVGVNTLSHLRTIGSLSEQLRNVEAVMHSDMITQHLEDGTGKPYYVSRIDTTSQAWNGGGRKGYFAVSQITNTALIPGTSFQYYPAIVDEGYEEEVHSYRTPGGCLFFTNKLSGADQSETYLANVGAALLTNYPALTTQNLPEYSTPGSGIFASKWAEISYHLEPGIGNTIRDESDPASQPLQLYSLFRRQRVLAPDAPVELRDETKPPSATNTGDPRANYAEAYPELNISTAPKTSSGTTGTNRYAFVNTPSTVINVSNRLSSVDWRYTGTTGNLFDLSRVAPGPGSLRIPLGTASYGTDLILSNVVSMQIMVMTSASSGQFVPLPFGGVSSIDTGATSPSQLRAVQIKLRVYDTKNRVTRQISVTQDL